MRSQLRAGRGTRNQQQRLLEHETQAMRIGLARGNHAADV
jgi:hypothetical protein